jgi:antirestriction protein ArdC
MANKLQEKLYQELTDRVIEAIESGNFGKWISKFAEQGLPKNPVSKRAYNGGNIFNLSIEAMEKGYSSNSWLTYKQAQDAGGNIKAGEKGTTVWFWQILEKVNKDGKESKIPFFKVYSVFNLDQTEGLDKIRESNQVVFHEGIERINQVEDFLSAIPHKKENHNGTPCYIPSRDLIRIPAPEYVIDGNIEQYYSVYFHELGHWTGHSSRLERKQVGRYQDKDSYAYEELIAELSSMFLCAEFGFTAELLHTEYLASWVSHLKKDTSFIIHASQSAENVVKYLKEIASQVEEQKVA